MVDDEGGAVEGAVGGVDHEVEDIAFDAWEDGLGLGVAHAYVVLDDVGVADGVGGVAEAAAHEADEDEAVVGNLFVAEAADGGFDDMVFDTFEEFL